MAVLAEFSGESCAESVRHSRKLSWMKVTRVCHLRRCDEAGAMRVVYEYVDPGPTPGASSPATVKVMRSTGRRDTDPELRLRRALHRRGLRFLVDVSAPGTNRRRRVDVLLRGARIAVFVDGCFWHSCPKHGRVPKTNREWWRRKLEGVVRRDRDTNAELASAGWLVVRVWEHEDPELAADRIAQLSRDRGC